MAEPARLLAAGSLSRAVGAPRQVAGRQVEAVPGAPGEGRAAAARALGLTGAQAMALADRLMAPGFQTRLVALGFEPARTHQSEGHPA